MYKVTMKNNHRPIRFYGGWSKSESEQKKSEIEKEAQDDRQEQTEDKSTGTK